jgi:hypothetical protein
LDDIRCSLEGRRTSESRPKILFYLGNRYEPVATERLIFGPIADDNHSNRLVARVVSQYERTRIPRLVVASDLNKVVEAAPRCLAVEVREADLRTNAHTLSRHRRHFTEIRFPFS